MDNLSNHPSPPFTPNHPHPPGSHFFLKSRVNIPRSQGKRTKNINHFLKTQLLSVLKVEKVLDNKARFEKKKSDTIRVYNKCVFERCF